MPDAPWSWSLDPAADGNLVLRLSGSWRMQDHLPPAVEVETKFGALSSARRLAFDTREVTTWDTGLLVFVLKVIEAGTPLVWFNGNARESRSPRWQNPPSVQNRESGG